MADMARMLGCTRHSVRYAVRKFGLSTIDGHQPPPAVDATLADRDWLDAPPGRGSNGARACGRDRDVR